MIVVISVICTPARLMPCYLSSYSGLRGVLSVVTRFKPQAPTKRQFTALFVEFDRECTST